MASDINTEATVAAYVEQEKVYLSAAVDNNLATEDPSIPSSSSTESVSNYWRKAGTAVTGGAITAIGLVMIPAPTPCGCVVAAYGLSVLGREFEGPQRIVEGAKQKLEGGLDAWAKDWEKDHHDSDDEEDEVKEKNDDEETQQKVDASSCESGDSLAQQSKKDDANSESSNNDEMLGADLNEGEADINEDETAAVYTRTRQEKIRLEQQQQKDNSTPKQSSLDAWGKVWKSHTTNFRKGTSSFISNKILPALRDIDLKHKKVGEESVTLTSEQEETVTSTSEQEEDALVQIGDYEVIRLSSEEVKRIQEEIEGHSSNNDVTPSTGSAYEVPASVVSMTSLSSTDEEASQDGEERERLTI